MYMLWAGVLIYPQIQVPIEAKRKLWVPGDVAIVSCEPPKVGSGKQEQQVLLKAEPPLQPWFEVLNQKCILRFYTEVPEDEEVFLHTLVSGNTA